MKRNYINPAMRVVRIQQQCHILSGSITGTDSNANLIYGGGGNGPARARSNGGIDWDEE